VIRFWYCTKTVFHDIIERKKGKKSKMAKIEVKCPTCSETQVIKYGQSSSGEQRYYCKSAECEKTIFQLEYRNKGCEPGIERKIIDMAVNASGIRDTSRVLKISTYKVMETLKKQKA
jgi:transposase-like protein